MFEDTLRSFTPCVMLFREDLHSEAVREGNATHFLGRIAELRFTVSPVTLESTNCCLKISIPLFFFF